MSVRLFRKSAFFRLLSTRLNTHTHTQFSGFDVFIHGNWSTANFVTNYLPFALFPILYVGSRFWYRCSPVPPMEMDFQTGLKEVEAATYDEPPPRNTMEKFWAWLVSQPIFFSAWKCAD